MVFVGGTLIRLSKLSVPVGMAYVVLVLVCGDFNLIGVLLGVFRIVSIERYDVVDGIANSDVFQETPIPTNMVCI
jgi:hypothetical protein